MLELPCPKRFARWSGTLGSWLAGHCPWVLVWAGACYWHGVGGWRVCGLCSIHHHHFCWGFGHPRTPVLSFAVTLFRVGLILNKTNLGLRTPTRSQPRLGLVARCGDFALKQKKKRTMQARRHFFCQFARRGLWAYGAGKTERRGFRRLFAL